MTKVRIVLSKPVYLGMNILYHSKWWMYGLHYNLVERYGLDRIRMAYMATDGIIYAILTKQLYHNMLQNLDHFDTSNYPQNPICYSGQNDRGLGKFKNEASGMIIGKFIGLMAKLHCVLYGGMTCIMDNGDVREIDASPPTKAAKGVNRTVVE